MYYIVWGKICINVWKKKEYKVIEYVRLCFFIIVNYYLKKLVSRDGNISLFYKVREDIIYIVSYIYRFVDCY